MSARLEKLLAQMENEAVKSILAAPKKHGVDIYVDAALETVAAYIVRLERAAGRGHDKR